ncbi:MAG: helix-turn-helix domain-containing protein [Pseudomonadota bacterium]|jgi:CRP/FNR family transcriptional regulator, nitrogen fixation regulation protein
MLHQINPVQTKFRPPAYATFGASPASPSDDRLETIGTLVSRTQDQEIFSEGEPAARFYKVIAGAVRTHKILDDGRRQIVGFHISGDFFGLEAGDRYSVSAEAVSATELVAMKRSTMFERASRSHNLFEKLWTIATLELSRSRAHALLLIKNAQERVQDFLLDFSERAGSQQVIELPMSRQDIADYLGLTIETVSRTLTLLEKSGLISLHSTRRITLNNVAALKASQR